MMRRLCLLLVLPILMCGSSLSARAGSYADALSQCLIRSTTPADQKTVLRWAFATMALDPDVASMSAITAAQRASINQKAGALVTDLLARSCNQPAQQALMFEGPGAARTAFEAWARWAITNLATEPHVVQGAGALLQYIDIGKLMSLIPLQGFPPASGSTH
jgi:hypothetical protein